MRGASCDHDCHFFVLADQDPCAARPNDPLVLTFFNRIRSMLHFDAPCVFRANKPWDLEQIPALPLKTLNALLVRYEKIALRIVRCLAILPHFCGYAVSAVRTTIKDWAPVHESIAGPVIFAVRRILEFTRVKSRLRGTWPSRPSLAIILNCRRCKSSAAWLVRP